MRGLALRRDETVPLMWMADAMTHGPVWKIKGQDLAMVQLGKLRGKDGEPVHQPRVRSIDFA